MDHLSSDAPNLDKPTVASLSAESDQSEHSYSILFAENQGAVLEKSILGEWAASVIRLALVIFAGTMYVLFSEPGQSIPTLAYTVLVAAGAYSVYLLWREPYRRYDFLRSSLFVSVTDAALVLLWIYATGGFASEYYPLLYASVVGFSFRYGPWETMGGALVHAGGYAALLYGAGTLTTNLGPASIRMGFVFLLGGLGSLLSMVAHRQTVAKEAYKDLAQRLEDAKQEIEEKAQRLQEQSTKLEARTDELERSNEDLRQFANAVSHDVREPLRSIANHLRLIEHRAEDRLGEEMKASLGYAKDAADRLDEMIQGLLAYSRVDRKGDPFETFKLGDALDAALENLDEQIRESGAMIEREPLPPVRGDPNQLTLLFQNLLQNAIRYSGDDRPHVRVGTRRQDDRWVVEVEDEGVGIPPQEQEQIFQIFQQGRTAGDGTGEGLGLALCKRILERHRGRIWVESTPGEGATFSFTLPTGEQSTSPADLDATPSTEA